MAEPGTAATEAEVLRMKFRRGNHASFYDDFGEPVAPGLALMRKAVAAGVAEAFASKEDADRCLGKTHPSPLGNLRKEKPGGWKDRVIHDFKSVSYTHLTLPTILRV